MADWFHTFAAAPGVTGQVEPFAPSWFRANFFTVSGRDADLQVDFGTGLHAALPPARPTIAVATHAHVDHVGAFHLHADRRGHAAEAATFAAMDEDGTRAFRLRADPEGLGRLPHPGFVLADWRLTPAPLTTTVAEGDVIDLGNRAFTVLHLPGHSPGSIALLDEAAGLLIAGDAIYDETLVDDLPHSDIAVYCATMERLRHLDVALVLGGHGAPFGRARLVAIAEGYLRQNGA